MKSKLAPTNNPAKDNLTFVDSTQASIVTKTVFIPAPTNPAPGGKGGPTGPSATPVGVDDDKSEMATA